MNNGPQKGRDNRIYNSINRKSRRTRHIDYGRQPDASIGHFNHYNPRKNGLNPGAVIAVSIIGIIIVISLVFIIQNRQNTKVPGNTVPQNTAVIASQSEPDESIKALESYDDAFVGPPAAITEPPAPEHDTVTMNAADIYKGSLILVNAEHEYHFPEAGQQEILTVYGNKTANLRVSDTSVALDKKILDILNTMIDDFYADTGKNDVLIRSGYRDYQTQVDIYADRVATQGEIAAAMYVANPGFSEHHTGWAMDLSVYTYDGEAFTFDADEAYSWITRLCVKYGFILRYPQDKVSLTGISYEPWHFRWVGTPHAAIITENNYCLEEYTDYLRENTSFPGEHLNYTDESGTEYEIYYVPANTEGTTEVPVPTDASCEISGNNVDGFVVTVTK